MRIALPARIDPGAFAGLDAAAPIVTLDGLTMGTTWRVLVARPRTVDIASVRAAIVDRLDGLVAEMSHWEPDSLLSRYNRAAPNSWMALPPDFAHVIAAGLAIAAESGGAFDPAIGRLVDLWGFGPPGPATPPHAAAIEGTLALSGWRRLSYDAAARRLLQPGGVALDLSGIAKGYAADAIAALLTTFGIRHTLIEVGGELVGVGVRPDGEPWWVDLENPPGATLPPLRVALHGLAVATSGNYLRGDHTIDPRTGHPVHGAASVSVIAGTAMAADAWASALTVLGSETGLALADRKGLAARWITHDGEVLSAAFTAMLAD